MTAAMRVIKGIYKIKICNEERKKNVKKMAKENKIRGERKR